MAGTRMRRNTKQTSAAIAAPVLATQGPELHECNATALALINGGASAVEAAVAPQEETLEEIDTEDDDSEFDERAHWGRRRVSAKSKAGANGTRKKKAPVEDKSQPKINLFCVQNPSGAKETKSGEAEDAGNEDDHGEGSGGSTDEAVDAVTVVDEDDDGNGGSSVEVLVKSVNAGPLSPTTNGAVSAEAADAATAIVLEENLMSPATITQSGRPKRQSVLRAEQAQLKASQESLFMTPPAFPPSKKTSANKATLDSEETEKKATTNSTTLSSRKRKLEMAADKKKPAQQTTLIPKAASPVPVVSPAQSVAAKASDAKPARAAAKVFFLTEEQKKQVIEIEAVTLLKEQLRQQRERDLAFFGGREVQNPFFQSRSQKIIDVDAPEVIEVLDTPESSPIPRKFKSRWSKEQEDFPKLQHVLQIPSHHEDSGDTLMLLPMRKSAEAVDVVVLDDEDEDMDESQSYYSVSSSPDAADSQVPLDDLFWLLSSSMQATSSIDNEIVLLSLAGDLSTDVMIDKISEVYGIKEKRVRQTLTALELARDKRQDKALNLSLVDRYLPVQTHGMIGNYDTLKKLSAWLSAWKSGGGGDRDRNYDDALFAFEGDDSDSDEDGTQLYRLFVLKGDVGSGKSAAVYACAEELGYEIIEINAGQLRTGKAVVDIAGEATQSTRVLHGGGPLVNDSKSKKKRSSSKKKRRKDGEPAKPSHLSLVLFEDVDLVFEEDKGFLSTLGSIAKHSKCPIVVTCRDLPSGFPSTPPAICESLVRPSSREFVAWLSLVAYLEAIPLTHVLATRLAELFACDVRRSLNFLQTYRQHIDRQVTHRAHDYHDSLAWSATQTSRTQADNVIAIADDSQETETETRRAVHVPAWSRHKLRSFDLCTSNFLPLLTGALYDAAPQCSRTKENDTRPREQKQRDVEALDDLWGVLDAVSFAEDWEASFATAHRRDDADDHFFAAEALDELTADVRSISLAAFVSRNHHAGNGGDSIVPPLTLNACPLGDGVERALQAAQELDDRTQKATRLATLKTKLELPLVAKGSARVDWRFSGDYMPMVARLLESSEPMQESRGGRRRTSRRNHYLSEILTDMALVDDIREFQDYSRYLEGAHDDEIVASSPFASPDPSPPTLPPHPLETSVAV